MSSDPSLTPWRISGSYFEACNCEAVCPCRQVGGSMGRVGGRSTYGVCEFALSWCMEEGHAGATELSGLTVVMCGFYRDDEPGSPWRVALYVDERADTTQQHALTEIFLGRLGGAVFRNFANAIGEVYVVRSARIELDHTPNKQRIGVRPYLSVIAQERVDADGPVSCGISGHDQPGQELRMSVMRVDDAPLKWEVHGRCGFASDFDYAADEH